MAREGKVAPGLKLRGRSQPSTGLLVVVGVRQVVQFGSVASRKGKWVVLLYQCLILLTCGSREDASQ